MAATRVALIGCGFFADNHLHSWRDLAAEGAKLVAVCDLDATKAERAAAQFGVDAYTDTETMYREAKPDLVDIVTQMATHRTLVARAISHGVGVIVQKPFGRTLDEVREMADLARRSGAFLAVHENFRFTEPLRRVRAVIASGAIGEVTWGRISFRTGIDVYAGQPYLAKESRFILIDMGVHVLDVARVLFGEVEHLTAELQRRNPKVGGEDTATLTMRHISGAVSIVDFSYESHRKPDTFPATILEIEGSEGAIMLRPDFTMEVTSRGEMQSVSVDAPLLSWSSRPWHNVQYSVLATCRHLLGAFRNGTTPETSAEDNFRTFALVEAAYGANGRVVTPEQRP